MGGGGRKLFTFFISSLAGWLDWEVDREVGEAEDPHEGDEALLRDKLPAVVVRAVVGQDRVHELHHVEDVVNQGNHLLLSVLQGRG